MEEIAIKTQKRRIFEKISAAANAVHGALPKFSARKTAIVLIPFVVLIAAGIILLNLKHVKVTAAGKTIEVSTFSSDPAKILKDNDITTSQYDKITFSGFENNNGAIKVIAAFKVSVTADKKTVSTMIAEGTVSDVLKKLKVTVGTEDIVSAPLDSAVTANQTVTVQRVTYSTKTTFKPIAFTTEKQTSASLKKGVEKLISEGKEGQTTVSTKVKYIDGVATDKQTVSETVTKKPVSRKVLAGTAASTPVSKLTGQSSLKLNSKGVPENYTRCITGTATGYSGGTGTRTASGRHAGVGYVAVDPSVIPYGTKLYIMSPGGSFVYGYAIAADTGDFVNNGSGILTDLYFASNSQCERFGARTVKIYVLD